MSRKSVLIAKLVVLCVLFVLVSAVAWRVVGKGWGSVRMNFGSGELIASEVYESADTIDVNIQSFSVEVQPHNEDTVRIKVYRSGFSTVKPPEITLEGSAVRVTQPNILGFSLGGGRVLIYVPADHVLDYSLETVSGSVRLNIASKSAVLRSVSGSIRATGGGPSVDASSVSGSIRIYAPYETVVCKTTSGTVRTSADAATQSIAASSVSGSVRVRMDGVSGYQMRYSNVSGSVKDEYNGLCYEKNGESVWGDESLSLDLRSTSGSIRLENWDD